MSDNRNIYIVLSNTGRYGVLHKCFLSKYKCLTKQWIEGDILRLKGERITIRLPEKDLRFIDSFIEQENENFPSRSELLRIAAKELIDRWIAQGRGRTGETLVFVANHHITAIDGLILRGEFKSREGALHEIIRNYLKSLEWDRIDEVEKRILEMRNKMAGMEKAEQFEKEIYER